MIFRLRIWVATLALALGAPVAARAQAPETVRVAVEWSLQSLHAFLHLADARGEFARRGVVVPIARGFGTLDTVNRVARGETDIGFGDLNVALTYNLTADPARRVVIVAPIYDESEAALVTWASEARVPADLRRKRLAAPAGVSARVLFPLFAEANGVAAGDVVWQNVSASLREFTLVKRQADGIAGSISTMLPLLRASGVAEGELTIFRYADFGVELLGFGFFARVDTVAARPTALRAFAGGAYAGIQAMLTDPAAGIGALVDRFPYIDAASEAYRWEIVRDRTLLTLNARQNGFGTLPPARVERRVAALARAAGVANPPAAGEMSTDRFLPPLDERRVPR